MSRKNEVLTAVGTLCCAMGIGFVMQSSDEAAQLYGPAKPNVQAAQVSGDNSLLNVTEIILTSGNFDGVPETLKRAKVVDKKPETTAEKPDESALQAPDTLACDITATAEPIAAAMVDLKLSAPCLQNETVTVHHNGMIFKERTSGDGTLDLEIPALSQDAVFVIAFSTGEGAVAKAEVQDLANFDRAVLQWKGTAGFEIHAREFGAGYGSDGHRWSNAPGELVATVAGVSGLLTRHGDENAAEPLMAEVYTFPRSLAAEDADIILTVEAEVTAENCGIEVEAQALDLQPVGPVETRKLILPVPGCDSIGSFLVLNNLLQDVKVATN